SIHVAVWSTPISLSWWLSTVDQLSLRDQTEGTGENNPNAQQLENIWKVLGATSDCVLKKLRRNSPTSAAGGLRASIAPRRGERSEVVVHAAAHDLEIVAGEIGIDR